MQICTNCNINPASAAYNVSQCEYCYMIGDYHLDFPDTKEKKMKEKMIHTSRIDELCKIFDYGRIPSNYNDPSLPEQEHYAPDEYFLVELPNGTPRSMNYRRLYESARGHESTINGFMIHRNFDKDSGSYSDKKDYLVFHPIYDGHFMIADFDTVEEAVLFCEKEDFQEWAEGLK